MYKIVKVESRTGIAINEDGSYKKENQKDYLHFDSKQEAVEFIKNKIGSEQNVSYYVFYEDSVVYEIDADFKPVVWPKKKWWEFWKSN